MADFQDWLPERMALHRGVVVAAARLFSNAGYREIALPILGETGLFARSSGEGSEVVTKEMYSFVDRGGRELSLRPEFTAAVVRAYLEHGMAKRPQPVRVFTCGTAYRYNRAQRGRYREFYQFDVEAIGSADPAVDAEVIALEMAWLEGLGLTGLELELNSVDTVAGRAAYVTTLREYLADRRGDLSDDVVRLLSVNPLRAFDTKDERSQRVLADAPKITDALSAEAAEHFAQVRAFLDARGVRYAVAKTLVRGLDYYTHSAWEIKWAGLGAQSTVSGGGRYDGLAEVLGGPPTPGIGFAAGVDRIVLALEAQGRGDTVAIVPTVDAFFLIDEPAARPALHAILDDLRVAGVACEADLAGRSAKGQWKHAERLGARLIVTCEAGDWAAGTLRVRDRASRREDTVAVDALVALLKERIVG